MWVNKSGFLLTHIMEHYIEQNDIGYVFENEKGLRLAVLLSPSTKKAFNFRERQVKTLRELIKKIDDKV
jgi:hypothetical protein